MIRDLLIAVVAVGELWVLRLMWRAGVLGMIKAIWDYWPAEPPLIDLRDAQHD